MAKDRRTMKEKKQNYRIQYIQKMELLTGPVGGLEGCGGRLLAGDQDFLLASRERPREGAGEVSVGPWGPLGLLTPGGRVGLPNTSLRAT